jgi:regulatory protein
MIRNTSYTVKEAKKKLEGYCSYQERCHKEVELKLAEMNMIELAKDDIIMHLMNQNYLNEERFAKSFARGKFSIKKWGKQRIIRELKFRNITEINIKIALKEFTTEEYLSSFNKLANKKAQNINEVNIYKKRKKLADYLLYRGWESDLVYAKVKELIP